MKKKMEKRIENWSNADPASLANHFHGVCGKGNFKPDERAGCFYLEAKDLIVFQEEKDKGSIMDVSINMALKNETNLNRKLTFRPILKVSYKCGKPKYLEFTPRRFKELPKITTYGGIVENTKNDNKNSVPAAFLESISSSWQRLNPTLIDDCFLASIKDKNNRTSLRRLRRYYFSKKKNSNIFEIFNNIFSKRRSDVVHIGFHLGADLNREIVRENFTFTPVLEFRFSRKIEKKITDSPESLTVISIIDNQRNLESDFAKELNFNPLSGLRVFESTSLTEPEKSDHAYLAEYIQPCPSTCPSGEDD